MSHLRKFYNLLNLMKSQWCSLDYLKRLQEKKLRNLLKYSYDNIPLYHNKFKAARLMPNDIKTLQDLEKIPFVTKAEIQNNYPHGIVSPSIDIKTCWTPRTSGSRGEPLTVVYDAFAEDFEKATALRPNLSCGQKINDKWVVITSPEHLISKKKWFQRLGFFSPEYLSLFENTEKQITSLKQLEPDVLDGYSSSLFLIAQQLKNSNWKPENLKIIYGTSELLSEDMRRVINSVFNLEMYDQFGCVEMGRTAWECPEHSGYHIDMESVIMEFIKDNEHVSHGERGEIVYTNLYNFAMPFIRYKIEDVGIPTDDQCPCGRGLPLMKLIEGRKDAFIRLSNGKIISPIVWTILLRPYNLKQYKVIQETENKIKIQIIPRENFNERLPETITKSICDALTTNIPIEFQVVDEIPREKSGKVRSVLSKVKVDW